MRRRTNLPELLSPAGDMEALYAAVAAGADAVYVGGKIFSARAYAKNFDLSELAEATVYCHLHGVKLYVTVNTLIYDKEREELVSYAKELQKIGVDALIIADLGAISLIRRAVPSLALHASTQMSLHNTPATGLAYALGCERAVLARECSLEDIRSAVGHSPCEIEVFLHGALCVCHSGQCLFSSLVGGRSGNRGECAQPCRLPYRQGYPLSLRDLSLAGHIEELIDSGVSSLKIEGRMKSPDYVYRVTRIYRDLLDAHRSADQSEHTALETIFSRGGFTDGYFTGHPERKMTGVRSEEDKKATKTEESLQAKDRDSARFSQMRTELTAEASFTSDAPATFTLSDGRTTVTVTGDVPLEAQNQPLSPDDLKARLSKMGNTPFSLSPDRISLTLGDGLFLSPGSVNALRRSAVEKLSSLYQAPADPVMNPGGLSECSDTPAFSGNTALFLDPTLPAKLSDLLSDFSAVFVPLFRLNEADPHGVNGVYLPPVLTDHELPAAREMLKTAKSAGIRYALVGNLGGIALAKKAGLIPIGDFRLNVMNGDTLRAYRSLGVALSVVSVELTLPMARDIARVGGASLFVCGRVPLMLTERCFMRENFGCDKCSRCFLTDRRGQKFPIVREYDHRNLILNSAITYMGDRKDELDKARIQNRHFLFTVENEKEARDLLLSYQKGLPLPKEFPVRRIGKREGYFS